MDSILHTHPLAPQLFYDSMCVKGVEEIKEGFVFHVQCATLIFVKIASIK